MAKRKNSKESDVEESVASNSHPSKRARVEDDDGNTDHYKATNGASKPEKGHNNVQGDNDEEGTESEADDEDKRFEAEYGDAVRASIEAKKRGEGRVAQHGIIQSLEMHQFMCHKRLSFSFGPQVNFIIGHNGSGKSAVLSAITVALGGKATSTGRGSGLKSFIREGQSVAEVTITLMNEGDEAYKPDIYGKSIVITRRFTKDGSSSYKIKSKDGKLISNKREELAAICDHMNIQVDNPMNVLTQDAARQFLSASHPTDKYKFFLKGTQLSQLSDEYETCLENIGKTAKVLEQKKDALPDLKKQVKEANTRYAEAHKALAQKSKADELKKELAWGHVKTKEDEMKVKIEEVAKASRRLPKIEENADRATAKFQEASDAVVKLENELTELGDIEHLSKQKKELQDKIRINKDKISDMMRSEKNMNSEIERNKHAIAAYETRIEDETRKLQEDAQAKRQEREKRLQAARKEVDDHEARLREVNNQLREKQESRDSLHRDARAAEEEQRKAQQQIQECSTQYDRCKEQEKNSLTPYGKNMNAVLEKIKTQQWCGQPPKGPLGQYVSLRDDKWAMLMRTQLGATMSSFAITDSRDRGTLKRILNETNNPQIQIIISEIDMFDFSAGEPPAGMLTVLRALEISDPYVMRILINQARVERTFLAMSRREGQDIVDSQPRGGTAWTTDYYRVQNYGDGGSTSQRLNELRQGDPRMLMFAGKDPQQQIRHWQNLGREADLKCQETNAKLHSFLNQITECRHAIERLEEQARNLHKSIRNYKQAFDTLMGEHNEDVPVNISALQEAKAEAEASKASVLAQFKDLVERKVQVNAEQPPLLRELDRVKAQINEFEEKRVEIKNLILEAVENRMKAQNDKNHFERKHVDEQKKIEDLNAAAKLLQDEFEEWTAKAEQYCERVENPRHPDEINRALNSVQKALADREKEQGATVEELQLQVHQAKERYEAAERDLKEMSNLNKVLKSSLIVRLARWTDFRRHIALRTKLQFQYHLSNRGYYGKVLFDHTNQTLQLKVQTEDQASTQSRDKDPRSLSGGEKSFSTICLLLSLWEAIGCPIRCLDEFDVFMDAVNRRISMKMMIDTANSSDSKQYILITPQDMSTVAVGPTVRVNRMNDPERGQNTLAFTGATDT